MDLISYLATRMEANRREALALVKGLDDEAMVRMPSGSIAMNHAAWSLSHLAIYGHVISALARGIAIDPDPKDQPHGHGSKPQSDIRPYGSASAVIAAYEASAEAALDGLRAATLSILDAPMPLARWRERWPTRGPAILHLVLTHEPYHLGQIAAWKKAAL